MHLIDPPLWMQALGLIVIAAYLGLYVLLLEFAADAAEAEAFRRGVHGYEKDVYFKGEVVGKEVIYSDRMLELMLKAVPSTPSEGDWESQSTAG